jgi:threonine dehydratase
MLLPTPQMIREAAARLRDVTKITPLTYSRLLSDRAGVDVYLKCENLQRTGSFKLRGAFNALATLPDESRRAGVLASSAGNHGLGVAYAAKQLGVRATIFVPADAPAVKRKGIVALGAEVDASQPNYDAAHALALQQAERTGMSYVNPCAGATLLAGQGTVALEILDELPGVKTIVAPVGGGGLAGGIGALLRAEHPNVRLVGAQSAHTDAMARSLRAGRRVEVDTPPTLADGLAGQIDDEGFEIGKRTLNDVVVVSEEAMADAILWLDREHGLRVEGSGAVGVAAVLGGLSLEGPVVVVLSGGNIDEERIEKLKLERRTRTSVSDV